MNGIDKIIERINSDASSNSEKIISEAKKQAEQIISDARSVAESKGSVIISEADEKCSLIKANASSKASFAAKQQLLAAKVGEIDGVISKVTDYLNSLTGSEYAEKLISMIGKYSQSGNCEIVFSNLCTEILDKAFIDRCIETALVNNCNLTYSGKTADIAKGFILIYGDIEINCTFNAVINENREELKELVNSILFQVV